MLVLSRKPGQKIVIGSNIEVIITEVKGNNVRVGISAPGDIPIHREEVFRRIRAEEAVATQPEFEAVLSPVTTH